MGGGRGGRGRERGEIITQHIIEPAGNACMYECIYIYNFFFFLHKRQSVFFYLIQRAFIATSTRLEGRKGGGNTDILYNIKSTRMTTSLFLPRGHSVKGQPRERKLERSGQFELIWPGIRFFFLLITTTQMNKHVIKAHDRNAHIRTLALTYTRT